MLKFVNPVRQYKRQYLIPVLRNLHYFVFVDVQLLESAFKKETVGLVTREQFVEKVFFS